MNDMDRSHDELLLELLEHYQRIHDIETCLKAQGAEPPLDQSDASARDVGLWATLLDKIPSAIVLAHANGELIMTNRRWQDIYGHDHVGISLSDQIRRMNPLRPDGTPFPKDELPGVRVLAEGVVIRNREMLIHRDDGTTLPVLVSAAPLFDSAGQVAAAVIVFDDIVEYKQMQLTLSESRKDLERQTFLLQLTEALRPIDDAIEIQNLATRLLGEHLGVERALYGEMADDLDHFEVKRDYHRPGLKSFAGLYALSAAAPDLVRQLHEGQTNVVSDIYSEQALTDAEKAVYSERELTAFIMVPLIKAGRMVAFLRVQCRQPRAWTGSDVMLVEDVAEHTWAAVERAKAEAALKQSEQTFRSILDNSRDGILLLDLVTERYRYISPSHADNTGFTLEELYGMSLSDGIARVHPDDLVITKQQYTSAEHEQDAGQDLEYRWKVKSGAYRWFRDRRKFIFNDQGQAVAMVAVSRDVTKWKNDERQIAFQAHLLEKVHDAIIATDHSYRITYWNKTAEEIFLKSAQEAVGRPISQLLRTVDRKAGSMSAIRTMAGLGSFSGELVFHRSDGRTLYVDVQTSVIRDAEGRLIETISSLRDITSRKLAEIQLRESEQRAMALVEKLQESDRNKSHFLSTLSHELRNPLAAMVISLNLLDHAQGKPEQKRRAEEILRRQTNQLSRLVDDLLNITRINENKIKLKREPMDLVSLVERVMMDYQTQFDEKGVTLSADLPAKPLTLLADPARLNQAIGNLLHNALKFTKRDDHVSVCVRIDPDRQEARIMVSDTGAGIDPEILRQLFQPFTQADRTLARTQGGLGLGLSIVRGLIELHGGTVDATSAGAGQGSCFEIRMPLQPASPETTD